MFILIRRRWVYSCLVVFLTLNGFNATYCQESLITKEIDDAIINAIKGNCEISIPILERHASDQILDTFTKLKVQTYLNYCYLKTNRNKIDVDDLNKRAENFYSINEISNANNDEREQELSTLFILSVLNGLVEKYDKMLVYLNILKKELDNDTTGYDNNIYFQVQRLLTRGYYFTNQFDKAIEIGEFALQECNKLNDPNNDLMIEILDLLQKSYKTLNYREKSLSCLEREVDLCKSLLGEYSPVYLTISNNLFLEYFNYGQYNKAEEIIEKLMVNIEKLYGKKSLEYFICCSNKAQILSTLGKHQESLKVYLDLDSICSSSSAINDTIYLQIRNNLGNEYSYLGENLKAVEILSDVVARRKIILGENDPDYIKSLNNLGQIYSELGNYKKALEIQMNCVSIAKVVFGEESPDYNSYLKNLAIVYTELGDYISSLEINLKVNKSLKEVLGERHPRYLTSLSALASSYFDLGNYKEAFEIYSNIVTIDKEIFGEKHPDYFIALSNLAYAYSNIGMNDSALEIDSRVAELRKELLGEKHPDYLNSLNNLASDYANLGDFQKALEINLKVAELRKELLGEKHPDYLNSLNNLASDYANLGDFQKALEINLKVAELRKEILGEKHPDCLISINNLASNYSELGDFNKSLELDSAVAVIRKELLGDKHPDYLSSLNNMALDYTTLGDFGKSFKLIIRVVELRKQILGDRHPDYLSSLNDMALTEFILSQFDSALEHKRQVTLQIQKIIIDYFSQLSENQRNFFWKKNGLLVRGSTLIAEYAYKNNPDAVSYIYDLSLFTKGILLNTTIDFDKLIAEKGSSEAIAKFEELKLLKLELQHLTEKPIAERYLNLDSLENVAQQKETELVKLSKEYGDYTSNLKITWKDVQDKLSENDVAIEFVEYPTLSDTVKYAALVLRKNWEYPRFIPLFRKDQIESYIRQKEDQIYSNSFVGNEIKKLLCNPINELIQPGDRVFFSPAGILHKLAIENLAYDDSTTLGDHYQMVRLSSTKELVKQQPEPMEQSIALYGGLKYDTEMKEMIAESKKYQNQDEFIAMRGYLNDTTVRSGWKYLNGTLNEADQISRVMRAKKYEVNEYTGIAGNEESFKALSGKKTGIIHIATHGFFLPIDESRRNAFVQMRMGDEQRTERLPDPMLRSGLMFAGGNRAWRGDSIPDNIEDGVLTAREISHMDLRGTDLVVLSACETGLGEVSGEGVFGLQRGFKQAGVKTIIMSLWNVKDEATQYLMTNFYTFLTQGDEKRVAFQKARNLCRAKYPDPASWAAFIMLD